MSAIQYPLIQFFNQYGTEPLSSGSIMTYQAGTTTPASTYTDPTEATLLPNPILLDSGGRPENSSGLFNPIFLNISTNYKFVIMDSNNNIIETIDNYNTSQAGLAGNASTYVLTSADATLPNSNVLAATAPITLSVSGGNATLGLTVPLTIAQGGTDVTSWAQPNGILFAGSASTSPIQNIVNGTTNLPLVSLGSASLPHWSLLGVTGGGTGTATPSLTAGSNIAISGTWPNNTISASGVILNGASENGTAAVFDTTNSTSTQLKFNGVSAGTGLTVSGGGSNTAVTVGLSSPVSIANGGTGQTGQTAAFNALSPLTTQGDIIYFNGTNNVRLGAGTANQALISNGTSANPSYVTAPLSLSSGNTLSGTNFITLFTGLAKPTTHTMYELYIYGTVTASTGTDTLYVQIDPAGGTSWVTSGYNYIYNGVSGTTSTSALTAASTTGIGAPLVPAFTTATSNFTAKFIMQAIGSTYLVSGTIGSNNFILTGYSNFIESTTSLSLRLATGASTSTITANYTLIAQII